MIEIPIVSHEIIQRLISYLESSVPQRRGRFTAEMHNFSQEEKDFIYEELKRKNVEIPDAGKDRDENYSPPAELTKEELKQISELSWTIRKNNPRLSLVDIIRKAQDSLPEKKRRKAINVDKFKPIIEFLKKKDEHAERAINKNETLEEEFKTFKESVQSKEIILQNLTEEDLISLGDKVLSVLPYDEILKNLNMDSIVGSLSTEQLIRESISRFISVQEQNANMTILMFKRMSSSIQELAEAVYSQQYKTPKAIPVIKLPKIIIFGLLPDQQNHILVEFKEKANISFVDKNRSTNTDTKNFEIVVLMTKFLDHATINRVKGSVDKEKSVLISHHGGISEVIEKIRNSLKLL